MKWAEYLPSASYLDVHEQSSPPPTSCHCRSSGANSPHGKIYHDVCEQYSPPPTSRHHRSSGANSPHGDSYRDVCEQYSPPPTSHHSRSSGANSPHGESYHDVCDIHSLPLLITVGVQGMTMECIVIQGGTGHHSVTVQWILENLQAEMYVTIHPL